MIAGLWAIFRCSVVTLVVVFLVLGVFFLVGVGLIFMADRLGYHFGKGFQESKKERNNKGGVNER